MMMSTLRLTAACTLAALLSACAGDGPTPQSAASAFDLMQREVINPNCLSAGCHNPQSAAAGLVLSEGSSFDALVGADPTNPQALAEGLSRVAPFDLDNSFFLRKLEGPGPGEGSQMPLGADPLSNELVSLVRDWIAAGAPGPEVAASPQPTDSPTPTQIPNVDTPTATRLPDTPTATPATTSTAATPPPAATATVATPTITQPVAPTNTPGVEPVRIAAVQDQILTPRCAVIGCHSGPNPSADLSLEEGNSRNALINVSPSNAAAAAAGLVLVEVGNSADSFLLVKVMNPTPDQGSRMPLIGDRLTPEQVQLIVNWIDGGAQ